MEPEPTANKIRREEVLAGALRVFAAKGYRGATIEDIANELGFTRAALYYYFDSKLALLTTLVFRPIEMLLEEATKVEAMDLDPRTKVAESVRSHVRAITEERDLFTVMIREQVELPAERLSQLRRMNREYHDVLRRMIDDGIAQGQLAVENSDLAALFIIGAINWTLQWYRPGRQVDVEGIARIFGDLAVGGLLHGTGR